MKGSGSRLDHRPAALLMLALLAIPAWAHEQSGQAAGFVTGLLHPVSGLDHVPLPGVEVGIAASAVLLGAMVATESRPPLALAAALVAFFAVFHGHAHGTELPPGQSGLLYSFGFVVATGCLHAVGIALGLLHRWRSGRVALRGAGAAVGLAGLVFLWRALA